MYIYLLKIINRAIHNLKSENERYHKDLTLVIDKHKKIK